MPTQTAEQAENTQAIQAETQTVYLDLPFKSGGIEVTKIDVRKPNVHALKGLKIADLLQGDVTSICTILPRISTPTLTPHDVNQLEPSDIAQVAGVIMLFLQTKSVRAELLQKQ